MSVPGPRQAPAPTGDDRFGELDRAFTRAIEPWGVGDTPLSLLFSGGVDSGLLAWDLRRRPGLTLVTVGVPGSPDLRGAAESADLIGAKWLPSEITGREVRETGQRLRRATGGLSSTSRTVLVALALALDRAPDRTVMCGQGVDELFLGYAHFAGLSGPQAGERAESDLRRLLEQDWPRSQGIAREIGRRLIAPYLDPGFVGAARAIPIEQRLPEPVPKALFRAWARHRGVPAAVAGRRKRAFQFGSGVDRLLRRGVAAEPPPTQRR